jgi:glycosyltransferase involved in cell wall biosynthesis
VKLAGRDDCQVHVLDCTGLDPGDADERLIVHRLEERVAREHAELHRYGGDDRALVLGESILEAFPALQAEHGFELVYFPECAAAMRLIQAKRHGALSGGLPVAVELDDPSFWRAAHGRRALTGPRDLKLDHCERYAFAHADLRVARDPDVLAAARGAEWQIGDVLTEGPDVDHLLDLARPAGGLAASSRSPASLTVVVSHYNHDRHLPGALASLAAQTRPPDEVIVIDDGSTSEDARRVFAEQAETYPAWSFVQQENAGPGQVRNAGLERAQGTLFLPFDSDNLAAPDMVERLLAAMESDSSPAALTCHNLSFVDDADIATGRFRARYSPTGGPRVLGCVENVYGDTCSIFDAAVLRAVGGFEVGRWSATEDWETFVKLVEAGYEVDVLPLPLFYYRTGPGGRLQKAAADPAIERRLRAHLIERFFLRSDLSRLEHRQLLEVLQAYDHFARVETENRLAEQRRWHDSQMADLDRFREEQLAEAEERRKAEVDAERSRSEALAGELESLRAVGLRRWARDVGARLGRG